MKKSVLTIIMCCLAATMIAKEMPKQGFGLQIGWAQPIMRLNSSGVLIPKDSLVNVTKLNGVKLGLVYDASYIAGFGSSIGINYTFAAANTGWKTASTISDYPRAKTATFYNELEVFVDWQYKFEVAKETYLILYTGPTIQCGLGYSVRTDTQIQSLDGSITTVSNKASRYERHDETEWEANTELKRLNVTWGVGAGFQYRRYFLRGGYDFGLINPYAHQKFVTIDRYTRGRLDQWSIKIGMYLWYQD